MKILSCLNIHVQSAVLRLKIKSFYFIKNYLKPKIQSIFYRDAEDIPWYNLHANGFVYVQVACIAPHEH